MGRPDSSGSSQAKAAIWTIGSGRKLAASRAGGIVEEVLQEPSQLVCALAIPEELLLPRPTKGLRFRRNVRTSFGTCVHCGRGIAINKLSKYPGNPVRSGVHFGLATA